MSKLAPPWAHVLRNETLFAHPVQKFENLDKFLTSHEPLSNCGISIGFDDSLLDIDFTDRGSETLMVGFSGAKKNKYAVPFFTGAKIGVEAGLSTLLFGEPCYYLSDEVTLGWYGGSAGMPLQSVLPKIIEKLMLQTSARRIMFFGGSGGGFASLFYSKAFPGSLPLVWNPQIKILRYNEHVRHRYAEAGFGAVDSHDEWLKRSICTDITEMYATPDISNPVVFLQNATDKHHVVNHMNPFLLLYSDRQFRPHKSFQGLIGKSLYLHLSSKWSIGHKPPPRKFLLEAVRKLSNCEWNDVGLQTAMTHSSVQSADKM